MKKLISIFLALVMIFSITACGQKESVPAVGDIVTDMEVSFGDGLPSQVLRGEYRIAEIPQEYAEKYGMFAYYVPAEGNDSFELALYRKAKDGKDLYDCLNEVIKAEGVENQEPIVWDYDSFNGEGDSHFAYTAFFVPTADDGNSYFARYYAFELDEDFLLVEYYNATKVAEFSDPIFNFNIINSMNEIELSQHELEQGAIAQYEYVLPGEMPIVTLYEDSSMTSVEQIADWFSANYETTVEYFYDYQIAGTDQVLKCVYLKYFEERDDVKYMDEALVTVVDGKTYEIEYRSPAGEGRDQVYVQTAAPALIWGSGNFNK